MKSNYEVLIHKYAWKLLAGFSLLVLLTPLFYKTNWQLPFTSVKFVWMCVFVELALIVLVYLLVASKELWKVLTHKVLLFVYSFGAVLLLTSFFGVSPWQSFWGTFLRMQGVVSWLHVIVFITVLVVLFAKDIWYRKLFQQIVVGVATITSVYGAFIFLGLKPIVWDEYLPRVSSLFGNPIFFASFLVVPIFLCLNLFLEAKKYRWVYAAGFVLNVLGLLTTASRGVVLGVVTGLSFALVVWFLGRGATAKVSLIKNWKKIGIVAVVVLAAVLLVPKGSYLTRLIDFSGDSTENRLIQWRTAWQGFKHSPVFGVGPENYYFVANRYFEPELYNYGSGWSDKPHNYLLELLNTIGIVGLMVYLGMVVCAVWYLYKAWRGENFSLSQFAVLAGAFVAYIVQDLFVFDTISSMLMWGFLLSVVISYTGKKSDQAVLSPEKVELAYGAAVVLLVLFVVSLSTVYKPNVKALRALDAINATDLVQLENATNEMGNLLNAHAPYVDRSYMAAKYAEAVNTLVKGGSAKGAPLVDNALVYMEEATEKDPKQLKNWLKLLDLYFLDAVVNNTGFGSDIEKAISKAEELAPNRFEPVFADVTYKQLRGDGEEAVKEVAALYEKYPENADVVWFYTAILVSSDKTEEAVVIAEKAVDGKVWPGNEERLQWLFDYYAGKQDIVKIEHLLDSALQRYKKEYDFQLTVAEFYLRLNRMDKVRVIVDKLRNVKGGSISETRLSALVEALEKTK